MPSSVGHAVVGYAATRGTGATAPAACLGAVVATLPDVDLIVGFAINGQFSAYHRDSWSHSPVALIGWAAAASLVIAGVDCAFRSRSFASSFTHCLFLLAPALLSHALADFVLTNPLVGPSHLYRLPLLLHGAAWAALDLVFYGLPVVLSELVLSRWRRSRRARRHA